MIEYPPTPEQITLPEEINFIANRFDEIFVDSKKLEDTITGAHHAVAAEPLGLRGARNTDLMLERMAAARDFTPAQPGDAAAPYGRFRRKQIIGRGARISGGVYLGRTVREAPTVDAKSPAMNALFLELVELRNKQQDALLENWSQTSPNALQTNPAQLAVAELSKNNLIFQAFDLVQQQLPYNEAVDHDLREAADIKNNPDKEISVDEYLLAGGGVCRHQVLVLGALIERLIDEGFLTGHISAERNYIPNVLSHAWLEFTAADGLVWILDPAQSVYIEKNRLPDYAKFVYGITE